MKFRHHRCAAALLMAGCTALLAACGGTPADSRLPNASPSSGEVSFAPASTQEGVEWLNDRAGGYGSTSGFYRTISRDDQNAQNLLYTDFATGQEIYLCNQPNCTHNTDSCTAWLSLSGAVTRVIPVGEKVVILYGGRSYAEGENSKPHVLLMNPDGSERRTIASFESTDMVAAMPRGGLARDAENLYFVLQSQDVNTRTLYAVNVVTEEVSPVCALPEEEEKIVGGSGDALLLSYTPGSYNIEAKAADLITQFVRLDPKTGAVTPLFSASYLDTFLGCFDGKGYLLRQDGMLCSYDLQTGQTAAEMQTDLPVSELEVGSDWAAVFDGQGYFSRREAMSFEEQEAAKYSPRRYYAIDLATGQCTQLPYTYVNEEWGTEQAMTIEAQSTTQFLLTSGSQNIQIAAEDEDGKISTVTGTISTYSLISKEDFLAGRETAVPVRKAD